MYESEYTILAAVGYKFHTREFAEISRVLHSWVKNKTVIAFLWPQKGLDVKHVIWCAWKGIQLLQPWSINFTYGNLLKFRRCSIVESKNKICICFLWSQMFRCQTRYLMCMKVDTTLETVGYKFSHANLLKFRGCSIVE